MRYFRVEICDLIACNVDLLYHLTAYFNKHAVILQKQSHHVTKVFANGMMKVQNRVQIDIDDCI